ncbi:hypothetical protein BDK51DRAFT_28976 [Blyttiomyces helicus]|uniref:Uncharacterized protein n=1 Tax=Blyttiomyces helicus TaxID=388810 RepID=A0A4P9WA52_9FUNG|nr:hypothetical protein BDK51DRAFT_28976 [Blyttiomyces helicus]|eukprot:RKO88373.1 hypothetical protein BDK51DRAFT_28976 [Blyttiomyces helicus]
MPATPAYPGSECGGKQWIVAVVDEFGEFGEGDVWKEGSVVGKRLGWGWPSIGWRWPCLAKVVSPMRTVGLRIIQIREWDVSAHQKRFAKNRISHSQTLANLRAPFLGDFCKLSAPQGIPASWVAQHKSSNKHLRTWKLVTEEHVKTTEKQYERPKP